MYNYMTIDENESHEEIIREAYNLADQYFNIIGRKELEYVVLYGRQVVGALFASIDSEEIDFDLVVHEDHQVNGIAGTLTDMIIEDFKCNLSDFPEMKLVCTVINPCILSMLRKKGFVQVADRGDGIDLESKRAFKRVYGSLEPELHELIWEAESIGRFEWACWLLFQFLGKESRLALFFFLSDEAVKIWECHGWNNIPREVLDGIRNGYGFPRHPIDHGILNKLLMDIELKEVSTHQLGVAKVTLSMLMYLSSEITGSSTLLSPVLLPVRLVQIVVGKEKRSKMRKKIIDFGIQLLEEQDKLGH